MPNFIGVCRAGLGLSCFPCSTSTKRTCCEEGVSLQNKFAMHSFTYSDFSYKTSKEDLKKKGSKQCKVLPVLPSVHLPSVAHCGHIRYRDVLLLFSSPLV